MAIALDPTGGVYVAGTTSSTNFPLLHAVQSTRRGSLDAFMTKVSAAGVLEVSTYLGGGGADTANAIVVDGAGNPYIAGQTLSTDLPVPGAFQATNGGQYDAFIAKFAAGGDTLTALSYLGGNGSDTATAIGLDGAGNVYVAGWTQSVNFPVISGFQSINAGTYGAFLTKVTVGAPPASVGVTPNTGSGNSQTFNFQFTNSAGAAGLTTVSVNFNITAAVSNACAVTYNRAANTLALLADAGRGVRRHHRSRQRQRAEFAMRAERPGLFGHALRQRPHAESCDHVPGGLHRREEYLHAGEQCVRFDELAGEGFVDHHRGAALGSLGDAFVRLRQHADFHLRVLEPRRIHRHQHRVDDRRHVAQRDQ